MKYKVKTNPVDAVQFDGSLHKARDIEAWSGLQLKIGKCTPGDNSCAWMKLQGKEDLLYPTDWAVLDSKGKFSVVTNDIFVALYDRA